MDGLGLKPSPPRRIGLTGGIGSGKSTVAALGVQLGATLVDTDAIARALTVPGGAAMPALEAEFGSAILAPDGALDRGLMRQLAFGDPSAKRRLEAVLHPLIGAEATRQAAAAAGVVLFDVPLLTESSHWRERVDRVLVVDCSEATQILRVSQRPGWSAQLAAEVLRQQASRERRRALADAVLHNDGLSLDELAAELKALWTLWGLVPAATS